MRTRIESEYMDEWDAFAPAASALPGQLAPPAAELVNGHVDLPERVGRPERARTLSLIDFLADYDARRNPPVYDIHKYGLFVLREATLPAVPGVTLSPGAESWLTVDFLDLPPRPDVPPELAGLLGGSETISPLKRPEVQVSAHSDQAFQPDEPPDATLVAAAEQWIADEWEPFAGQWAEVNTAKTLHRDLFQQRALLATDRESVELVLRLPRFDGQG